MKNLFLLLIIAMVASCAADSEELIAPPAHHDSKSIGGGESGIIKGYPILSGNRIICVKTVDAICLVILEPPTESTPGHYKVTTEEGDFNFTGTLVRISSTDEEDTYEIQ